MSRIIAARLLARLTNMPRALLLWIADSSRQDVAHQKHCVFVYVCWWDCALYHTPYIRACVRLLSALLLARCFHWRVFVSKRARRGKRVMAMARSHIYMCSGVRHNERSRRFYFRGGLSYMFSECACMRACVVCDVDYLQTHNPR